MKTADGLFQQPFTNSSNGSFSIYEIYSEGGKHVHEGFKKESFFPPNKWNNPIYQFPWLLIVLVSLPSLGLSCFFCSETHEAHRTCPFLKGRVHPNNEKLYSLTYLQWYLAMEVVLVLFVQVLRYLSLRFLTLPQIQWT